MPEIRHYVVSQTREVRVTANSLNDAMQLASAAFEHGQDSNWAVKRGHCPADIWGNTVSPIKETSAVIERTS